MQSQKSKTCCCCFTVITGTYVLLCITTLFWGGLAVKGILSPGKVVNITDIDSPETNSSSIGHSVQRSTDNKASDHTVSIFLAGIGALGLYAVIMNKPLLLMPYLIYRVIVTSFTVVFVTVFVSLMLLAGEFTWSLLDSGTSVTEFVANFLSTQFREYSMTSVDKFIRTLLVDTTAAIAVVILLALVLLVTEIHFVMTVCRCYKMLGIRRSPEAKAPDATIELRHQPSAPIPHGKWHHMSQATDVLI